MKVQRNRNTKLKQKNHSKPQYPSVLIFIFSQFPSPELIPISIKYTNPQPHKHTSDAKADTRYKIQNYLLPLPRVYPSHHLENMPPLAAWSFQLARRVAISAFVDSRFWVCRFEKRPWEEPAELRRRSPRLWRFEPVPSVCLFPSEEVEVLESFILVLVWVWRCGKGDRWIGYRGYMGRGTAIVVM